MSPTVYLALGTNLGDRLANLSAACQLLPPGVQPTRVSAVYETPPWGVLDQPAFLNAAVEGITAFAPLDLLDYLKSLETRLGRQPGVRYGPRLIDLDILYYDELVFESARLTIPHPRLAERAFMLVPLADLAPHFRHPQTGLTTLEMLARLNWSGIVRLDDSQVELKPEFSIYPSGGTSMHAEDVKPLNWTPTPGVGYSVTRRPDGGMHYVFTDLSQTTLKHWREFALSHLLDSDRLTTNLYDLRQIGYLPEEAINYALEVNSDPAVRNIRLAVVVSSEEVRQALLEIDALSAGSGVEMAIFTDVDEAETWLKRPLTYVI